MFKKALDTISIKRHRSIFILLVPLLLLLLLLPYLTFYLKSQSLRQNAERRDSLNNVQANKLPGHKQVRVLCMIITTPKYHTDRAVYVKRTWGQYCNRLLFMSREEHAELESVALYVKDEREHNWGKIKAAFKYVQRYHLHEADWFLMTHDDTFVILENLRHLLQHYSPKIPIYFGCKMKSVEDQNYKIDGPGYVLSKAALNRFINRALPNDTICSQNSLGAVDVELPRCLRNVDVLAGETRDDQGTETFIPYWFPIKLDPKTAQNNITLRLPKHAISLHKVKPNDMFSLDFFIHRMRLFGKQ